MQAETAVEPATAEQTQMLVPVELAPVIERLDRIEKLLADREARTIPDRPMSPAEVAKIVGKSTRTVIRWLDRGKLRAMHEGGIRLIRPVDLQRFLEPKGASR